MKAARKVSQMMLSKKDQSHVMRAVEECNY